MCLQPARRCYLQPDGDRGRQGQLAPLCLARQPEKLKLRESVSARSTPAFPAGSVVAEVVVLPLMQITSSNCPVRSHADLGVSSVCFFFFFPVLRWQENSHQQCSRISQHWIILSSSVSLCFTKSHYSSGPVWPGLSEIKCFVLMVPFHIFSTAHCHTGSKASAR